MSNWIVENQNRVVFSPMAKVRGGVKWLLFLSSYVPLYFILLIQHYKFTVTVPESDLIQASLIPAGLEVPILSIFWAFLSLVSLGALLLVLFVRKSKGGQDFKPVDSYESRDDLVTTYILVYIFPFVVLDYTVLINWVAFFVFFLVIGIIQVRSSHLYINPMLSLANYRVYEVESESKTITLISKGSIDTSGGSIRTVELSNNVHMSI